VTIMPGCAPGSTAERKIWEPDGSLAASIIPSDRPNGVFHAYKRRPKRVSISLGVRGGEEVTERTLRLAT
jgi:hypothetical protein